MRVIYHCYGRAHSSVIAAYLHLGKLPMQGPVTKEQIMAIPEFDLADASDWGKPYFVGEDTDANEVFILGLNSQTQICCQVIYGLACHLRMADQLIMVNTLTSIGLLTRVGGFLSKQIRWRRLGRPLAARGIVNSLPKLRSLVAAVKNQLQRDEQSE